MSGLTERQQQVADNIDTAGLGLLALPVAAGMAGKVLHGRPGTLGAIGSALERYHESPWGPATDLAGLALIAPPVMHRIARGVAPTVSPAEAASPAKLAYWAGVRHAACKFAGASRGQMSAGGYTREEASRMYPHARGKDLAERHKGLNEELEHRDVTQGQDAITKRIVDAHLEERPDYYARLSKAMG